MPAPFVAKLSKKAGISKKRGEYLWGKAKKIAKGAKPSNFYAYTTGILKKMTGQESIDDLIDRVLLEGQLAEGSDLYCPNCHDRLGKQSEVEGDAKEGGCKVGEKVELYCSNCGYKWKHRCEYDTRD